MTLPTFQCVGGVWRWHLGDQEPEGCRYVIGEPWRPGWRFCQQPIHGEGSYCEEHAKACLTPLKRKAAAGRPRKGRKERE